MKKMMLMELMLMALCCSSCSSAGKTFKKMNEKISAAYPEMLDDYHYVESFDYYGYPGDFCIYTSSTALIPMIRLSLNDCYYYTELIFSKEFSKKKEVELFQVFSKYPKFDYRYLEYRNYYIPLPYSYGGSLGSCTSKSKDFHYDYVSESFYDSSYELLLDHFIECMDYFQFDTKELSFDLEARG